MTKAEKTPLDILDEMATKILMVEPGDLSLIGELLDLLDQLLSDPNFSKLALMQQMATVYKEALEKIIMGELADSAENYDRLGQCITQMHEAVRRGDQADAGVAQEFCKRMTEIGISIDKAAFGCSEGVAEKVEEKPQPLPPGEVPEFLENKELLGGFIEEAFEHLEAIEVNVVDLEKNPGDQELINSIFRSFHTIKGTANLAKVETVGALAHTVETLLDEVRSGARPMDQNITDLVLGAEDHLRAMVENVKDALEQGPEQYKVFDISDYEERVKNIQTGAEVAPASEGAAPAQEVSQPEPVQEASQAEPEPAVEEVADGGDVQTAEEAPSLDFLEDTDLLSGFIDEAFEHLESIETNVLDLEQSPDDMDIVNNIFRPFHTIKGVSGFLNLKKINVLAHATENLLDDVRNGARSMDSDIIDIVLNVGDCLKSMVENVREVLEKGPEHYEDTDINEYIDRIKQIQQGEGGESPAEEAIEASTPPPAAESQVSEPAEETPPSPVAKEAQVTAPVEPPSQVPEENQPSTPVAEPPPPPPAAEPAKPPPPPPSPPQPKTAVAEKPGSQKRRIGSSIKVDVEKLDALVNAVGELVIMQSLVRQNPLISGIADPKLTKDFSQLSRITSELQKTAMSMRMVPIRQTFDKMIRLVRDLSKKTGKKVDLVMEGAETEIDRNMVDSIYDPLVHMMRNSVDHGVSPPEQREKVGKPGTGTVHLRAYQKGGNIVIEIQDDGEGLNTEKVRKKAIERGLIQESASLSDFELNNMIFLPGFSTADKITDVSGRGVGMDVVKKAVDKLRGKVEVNSWPGKGSQFLIRLPLTLAIIDGIIVRVGPERYIIPTVAIQESMHPEKKNYNTIHGKGETLLIRGDLVPIVRLYDVFNVDATYTDPCDAIVVVVENEGRKRALMVDELLGKEEVVIKSLGGYMKDVKGVAGGTILGDGRVGLILDLSGLIASNEEA